MSRVSFKVILGYHRARSRASPIAQANALLLLVFGRLAAILWRDWNQFHIPASFHETAPG
jgi:hypothetical protein